jgi:hypothetical protein
LTVSEEVTGWNIILSEKLNTHAANGSLDEDSPKGWSEMGKQRQQSLTNAAKTKTESKKSKLLANPDVKRWYDNTSRSSPTTAEPRLRKLSQFCEAHQMTPMQLAELGMKDLRAVSDLLQDHITAMEQQGKAPQYIKSIITSTKSWLSHFDIQVTRKLKIANIESTPTLEAERVPEGNDMSEILNRCDLFSSTAISLIAKAGLRLETLGNHDGTDGLTMRDLPDLVIRQGFVTPLQTPLRIVVRRTLSKAGHQYMTFLTIGGTKRLVAYLNDRLARGEVLNAESPLLVPDYIYKTRRGRNTGKPFLPTARISQRIRETLRPRFTWRPYVFRAYFDTQLLIAEAKGKMPHDFRVFFMGHKGSIEAKYTTNKGILPEDLLKEMRSSFKRSEEFLDLETQGIDPLLQQKEELHDIVLKATPEELGMALEMLRSLGIGKSSQDKV